MKEWNLSKKLKLPGMEKLLLILLVGIVLLVICIPTSSGTGQTGESSSTEETDEAADTLEKRLQDTLQQVEGVGNVKVMITCTTDTGAIEGVVVVAEGADSPQVTQEITETAQALFPVAVHKIKVCKMTE